METENMRAFIDEIRVLAVKVKNARNSDESLDYSRQLRIKTQELEKLVHESRAKESFDLCGAEVIAPASLELIKCRLVDGHSPQNIHSDGTMFHWDDREILTSWPSRIPQTCAICGKHEPSHVQVRDGNNLVADRLCASHTFYDVIRTGKFFVEVSVSHDP